MNHQISRWYVPALGLLVAAFAFSAPVTYAAGSPEAADDDAMQAGLSSTAAASVAAAPSTSWLSSFASIASTGEIAAQVGSAGLVSETGASLLGDALPILGSHPTLGPVAAPLTRFRDGGHAYYLYGAGLHSCTYVGKCMDLFAPIGEPVYAMADGVVSIPKYAAGSYGNHVKIKFRDGSKAIYAHLNEVSAKPGPVAAGARIGTVGCSGTSGESSRCKRSGQHLHLEWNGLEWKPGQYGQLPPYFDQWRGEPMRCYKGCGPDSPYVP